MLKYFLLTIFFGIAVLSVYPQDLYMPRNVKQAYKKETRSLDGKPGKNYWQNYGRYNITITAMPPDRNIKGSETITYINNSPDTLRSQVIKLFLNIHKPGAPRERGASSDYLTSGVQIDACKVDGQPMTVRNDVFTNLTLRLPKPLLPHDSVQLSFDWHYEISLQSDREGMIDSTTYFLAYFYPRVSVYDDQSGWDNMAFVDSHEFYSDFNDYTVTLNVPKNYIVWGTGTLQHPETLLQPTFLKRYNESLISDETVRIVTKEDLMTKNITTQNEMNSWQFKATNIPDMAFGISDHYVWDGCSAVVDDATKRRASAQAAYNDKAADYHYVAQFARHSIDWLSHNWPGVPYPYEKTIVFHGYAGMEYPMMANDASSRDTNTSKFTAEHEIAHTYMPFYMGINETRYGFMDEGWATTFELLIGRADVGVEKAEQLFKAFRVNRWASDPSPGQDVPIASPGDNLSGAALGNNEYGKPALGYLAMMDLLGDELFKKCLHAWMDRWHGKHPLPWDFFYTFNNVAGKNLNWFWNNWFFKNHYIDLALKTAEKTKKGYAIAIQNIGGMVAPVNVVVNYSDGTKETFHQNPSIWENNQTETVVNIAVKKEVKSITLDGGIFVDADKSNNDWGLKGF
ncbi:MAG: M1 family metallopeptidase [Bacteroidota bacterium]